MAEAGQDSVYVARAVRDADRARYLSALFAGTEARRHLMALLAFHCELARIPGAVSEAMLGEIRLQWWRERIAAVADGGATSSNAGFSAGFSGGEGPVVRELGRALAAGQLEPASLFNLIDAWEIVLHSQDAVRPENLDAVALTTEGALHGQMARLLGGDAGEAEAARHAGAAWGLVHAMHRAGDGGVDEVRRRLGLHIDAVADLTPKPPRRLLPAFLVVPLARQALRKGQTPGPAPSALRVMWAGLTGRV